MCSCVSATAALSHLFPRFLFYFLFLLSVSMSGKLARKSSIVLGQNVPTIFSQVLGQLQISIRSTNVTADMIEFLVDDQGSDKAVDRVVFQLIAGLVKEACGDLRGVIKRPEGDLILDASSKQMFDANLVDFASVVSPVGVNFDKLPSDGTVAAIADMTYQRCVTTFLNASPAYIQSFPVCLRGNGQRGDFAVGSSILMSYRRPVDAPGTIRAFVKSIESVMGRMCSVNFVESVLPASWKKFPAATDLTAIEELLEDAASTITEFWQASERRDRAKSQVSFVMSGVGADIRNVFQDRVKEPDATAVAAAPSLGSHTDLGSSVLARSVSQAQLTATGGVFRCSRKTVELAVNVMDDWIATCEKMTSIDWGSEWGTTPFQDAALAKCRQRLATVVALRTVLDEVAELLDPQDIKALRGDTAKEAFDSANPFDVSPTSDVKWAAALASFNRRLEPIEHRCAVKLTEFFATRMNLAPQVILNEFSQYREIAKRPIVVKALVTERDTLLAKLSERVQAIRIEYEQRAQSMDSAAAIEEDRKLQAGRFCPVTVNRIVWVRQVRGRVAQMEEMCRSMLGDLARARDFESNCANLIRELEDYEQEMFKNWTFDVHDNARTLTLDSSSPIVRIDKLGKVDVNYPERLVELLREVRLLGGMGFVIPKDIAQIAAQALKFYQSGVALKQIGSVYNTMHGDILKCTEAMFYESAVAFDQVVGGGSSSKITWAREAETEKFIAKLRKAAAGLTDDNRIVHRIHSELCGFVVDLFKIDLLRAKDRWMGRVRAIRDRIVRSNYHHTEAWMTHWDMQIYKALEHRYQMGLESLHETLPEIRADIVVDPKTGRAAMRPPLTQLREQYYAKLRDFITFPCRFTGIGGNIFFKKMPAHNERALTAVMQGSSSLFRRIEKELRRFQPLLVLGCCGMNGNPSLLDIVAEALQEVQQWEANFRLLKQKGKEIGAVDTFIKVDCITLSTAGVKSVIEEQLAKLADALNVTLKRSAQSHLAKIDAFLDEAIKAMDTQYTKLEDMNKAHLRQAQLHEQRPAYDVEFHHFNAKNKLLQSVTNSVGIDGSATKDRWDAFINRLDSFEREMDAQLDKMKASVSDAVKDFFLRVDKLNAKWQELKPKDPKATGAMTFVVEQQKMLGVLVQEGNELASQCNYFHMDEPDRSALDDLKGDMAYYVKVWEVMDRFNADSKVFKDENWITFRAKLFKFEDFVKQWQDSLKELPSNPISLHLRTVVDEWWRVVPLLKFVRGDAFTHSHWTEFFKIVSLDRSLTVDTLLFGHVLDAREAILRRDKDLKALHLRAQGEAQIREALDDVRSYAASYLFKLVPHPDRKGVALITEWKEVMSTVNDNQALIMSLKDSPHFGPFAEDANQWEAKFVLVDEYLHHMVQIQRKWLYLEPIFARGALPHEQPRFLRMDKEYLTVMKEVERDARVMSLAVQTTYKEKLRTILEQLDRCQKALNEFLEQKRDRFPRFYFISDDDLLEILGQSRNPQVIQSHLKKLFMGIHTVRFDKPQKFINEIVSFDGELVTLSAPVEIKDEVEDWLRLLDDEMQRTLQRSLLQCVEKLDVAVHASQILCLCEQIQFTKHVEEAFREPSKGGLRTQRANLAQQLRDLTTFAAGNVNAVLDLKLKALIMDLIHMIEVVDLLMKHNVDNDKDWLWRKQLRFYVERGVGVIRMVDARFNYSYEYQGNAPKLVHTPLTDRCYLTLTQGMHLGYGGNPYGPAGTGKTESVKALGNCLGRQVLVFNCDEGIDFKSMGRIFTGLVKCGAWGCFDEFNRLKVDQLSAVSQMIQVIQEALKQGDEKCLLLGRTTQVNPNAGIFVTLNPAGKGYGGRSKLPDNLKQLFRSVAMSIPDNRLIAETIFYSEGFENASELGQKVVEIFRLSKQLLSSQQHYDWGLRALKAVLRLGGTLIKQFLKEKVAHKSAAPATSAEILRIESEIIIKSLRVNTLSKLTFDDVKLFNGLIADVFPGVAVTEIAYAELKPAILTAVQELKLQLVEGQVQKVLQLYEALNQRMGVVLVGPSGSGKSTLLRILRKAMQNLKVHVPLWAMNPKAMHRDQLLGRMDMDTREWFDGVLTKAAKKVVREEPTVRAWIYCDGDIDPEWVESLNSVLDDNKLLTMPNGVRIQFGGNVNFVFETHTLEFASPATVSRMGMIFLSQEDVDSKAPVASWLADQPPEAQGKLKGWLGEYLEKAIDTLLATKALVVETTKMGLVMSALSQLHHCQHKAEFTIGLINGLGSYLTETARVEFAKDIYHMLGERPADSKAPLDCFFNANRGQLVPFQVAPPLEATVEELRGYPMVSTIEVQRCLKVIDAWVKGPVPRPFILVGPEGCGKTMLLQNAFASLTNVKVAMLNCSAQTVALHVIRKLQQMCQVFNTTQGRVLRPKEADRLILVLKDLNLPKPDKYATVQLHSFLQQLILYQGFYDADLEWVSVERVQLVASMNPPGSMGRFPVASRFVAIVSVLYVSMPAASSLQTIYSEMLSVLLSAPGMQQIPLGVTGKGAADFARVIVNVFDSLTKRHTVDEASHYIFTPRDLTNWILNVLNYAAEGTDFTEMLAYECLRTFADRLVKNEDRAKLEKYLYDQLASVVGWQRKDDKDPRFFASWLCSSKVRKLSVTRTDDLKKAADQSMTMYAREFGDLDVQLIPETLSWMARLDRVLVQPGGHALIVARSGMSSSAVTLLCAYQLRYPVFTLKLTKDYSVKSFQLDVKPAIAEAGAAGNPCVLLLEDHNFGNTAFLEMINSLLSAGEIPGFYSQEETDALIGPLKEEALSEGVADGAYGYFLRRVMRNLHVVVLMDPTHTEYEPRCRSNPALFTRCSVFWMGAFSQDSLRTLPKLVMRDVFRALDQRPGADKDDFKLSKDIVAIHQTLGDKFSPQHFKTLMLTYKELYRQKHATSGESLGKLEKGLAKLAEAEVSVASIRTEVTQKKIEMELKQKEADEALVEIQSKMTEAGEQKKQIQKVTKDVDAEQTVISAKKSDIQQQLSGIQPTLDAAKEAVGQIKSEHLSELNALKTPPAAVQDVLEGVMTILGKGAEASNWQAIRKFMAGGAIKQAILNFDASSITHDVRNSVSRFLDAKANSFKPEVIGRASLAASPMAAWVKANVEYSLVLERIQPLTNELAGYEANLQKGKDKLSKLQDKLTRLDQKKEELTKRFGEKTREAERLKDKLEQAEATLASAEDLLGKLTAEKARWVTQVKSIQADVDLMPRKTLLASAFITYLGREPEDARRRVVQTWRDQFKTPEFDFFTFLRTESTMLQYKAQGLPSDELSLENAVIILEQVRCALIVDPANQASEWLKKNLKSREFVVESCTMADERFSNTLELAVRFGKTLLICEVDRIDPMLYPLIRKEFTLEGPKKVVRIGDKLVDYHETFQLFFLTRATDLKLMPDIAGYLSEISFTITRSGLEGQLLGITIQHEQPELEKQKLEMLKNEESLKLQLSQLEDTLLRELASSQGSLLENKTLIESLNQIKTQAISINETLDKSKELAVELDAKREVYRPFAAKGSSVFFLMRDLKSLSHMYQFSLSMFLGMFQRTLSKLAGHAGAYNTADKIEQLSGSLIQSVVVNVSRALFKSDRITFGAHLTRNLTVDCCTDAEWMYFTGRLVAAAANDSAPSPSWVPKEALNQFKLLKASFPQVVQMLNVHETDTWYTWMRSATPEEEVPDVMAKLKPFQQLMVIAALRTDRLMAAVQLWACKTLNVPSLSDTSTLTSLLGITTPTEPVLLLTTPGADPSQELQNLAHQKVGRERFFQVAMGGGQQEEATTLLQKCSKEGLWLCLKNLHLVIPWVSVLEQELNLLKPHPDFRLWLTSEPHDAFPSILLSSSLKVTFEAPPGLKQNMLRTYNFWTPQWLSERTPTQAQLLFSAAYLHSILQERRSYIPQGWAKFYEFSQADLKSTSDVILAQSAGGSVDWRTIHGVLENAIYGGRMETEFDVRILRAYLSQYFNELTLAEAGSKKQLPIARGLMLPGSNDHAQYMKLVNALPDSDIPTMFALPPNADRVVQRTRVTAFRADLVKLQERKEMSKMSRDEWAASVTPILNAWHQLCQSHADLLTTSVGGRRDPRPIEGFVHAELENSILLLRRVDDTMTSLKKVIDGTLLLSERLKVESAAMILGEVPLAWDGHFSGPEAILPWLSSLVAKAAAIRKWSAAAGDGSLIKGRISLADLFRPQTFLNALRQETARVTREPLVNLQLRCSVTAPPAGCAIPVVATGLLLQSAVLEGDVLAEITSSDVAAVFTMPDTFIGWVSPSAQDSQRDDVVTVPVYTNLTKEVLLTELQLRCTSSVDVTKFILAGISLMLQE